MALSGKCQIMPYFTFYANVVIFTGNHIKSFLISEYFIPSDIWHGHMDHAKLHFILTGICSIACNIAVFDFEFEEKESSNTLKAATLYHDHSHV